MCQLPGDQTPHDGHLDEGTVGQDEQHQLLQQQEEVEDPRELQIAEEGRSGKNEGAMKEEESRQTWENKAQFILACIGNAVGLGNMWRFPYLCYKSGGGAFLLPYFLMLFLCGIPLLLMEVTVGQYTRRGPIAAMGKICPLFKGAGVGTVVISFLLSTYYNVIMAWVIYYLVHSFYSELPWTSCNATWAVNCFDDFGPNVTAPAGMKSVTEEFFDQVVLEKTGGIHEPGELRLELLLALFVAWVAIYFALWKSIRSSGRVVYVTATLPYLLIGAFVWRALTLPGASRGLQYFFSPRWELLANAEVWINAAAQNFNSIGIAFGSMIAFSSYNKFNNNIVVDTWAITLTNSLTSLLAGTIVFSTMGNIALEQGKDIDDVVAEGPGLVFVVYPQALAKMPYANVWAVLFFSLLLVLGVDSQFATVEVIVTSLTDAFPNWIKKYLRRHEFLVLVVCTVSFLLGIPNIMQGGIYFFNLIDYYTAAISLMYLAFFEVVAIVWIYGANRLARNVQEMTGRMPSLYFRFCWYLAAPVLILTIWIFSMVDYQRPSYNKGEYAYPDWAIGIGWLFASCSIAPIPIFAVIAVINAKGTTLWEKVKNSIRSPIEDCPCCGDALNCLEEKHHHSSFKEKVKLVVYTPDTNNDTVSEGKSDQMKEAEINGENVV
uniref:Transporter n=1 Tax=Scylla olivacea TaxID=85551 RepID=A0A0P4W1Q3_SCYOL